MTAVREAGERLNVADPQHTLSDPTSPRADCIVINLEFAINGLGTLQLLVQEHPSASSSQIL